MRKLSIVIGIVLLFAILFVFRNDILFSIQSWRYHRLPQPQKIWAHRVNSLERLRYLQHHFDGLEADIFYDTTVNSFIINHPPSTFKELNLQSWLQHLDSSKKVWFDVKLLDSNQIISSLSVLDTIAFNRSAIIFECYDLKSAIAFSEKGLKVALNIDLSIINGDIIKKKLYSSMVPEDIHYVSQEDLYVDSLKSMFPKKKVITWSTSFYHIFHAASLKKLLNDKQVEVVLVNVKSRGYL